MRQQLFYNDKILDELGVSLGGAAGLRVTNAGVSLVGHLLNSDFRFNSAGSLGVREGDLAQVVRAIPQRWIDVLHRGPLPLQPDEWAVATRLCPAPEVFQVQEVLVGGRLLCDTFTTNNDASFGPTASSTIIQHDSDLIRAQVVPFLNGHICEGPKDVAEAVLQQLTILQGFKRIRVPLATSTVKGTYQALAHGAFKLIKPHAWTTLLQRVPPWRRIWRWVWSPHRQHKVRDFLFRLLHRRLQLGYDRRAFADDINCAACTSTLETYEHFLHDCPVVSSVWRWFRQLCRSTFERNINNNIDGHLLCSVSPGRIAPARRSTWRLFSSAHGELLYSVWLQRCSALLDDAHPPFSAAAIIGRFVGRMQDHLNTLGAIARFNDVDLHDKFRRALLAQPC
jgi:hypothetical protein